MTNLTVVDSIESNQITFNTGYNFFTNDILNFTFVKKGYVPLIRLISGSDMYNMWIYVKNMNGSSYPDYVCFNNSLSNGTLIGLRNIKTVQSFLGSKTSNIAVQFRFDDPIIVNLTLSYSYRSFGTFRPFLLTSFGGNFHTTPNSQLVVIRNIDSYPFQGNYILSIFSSNFIFIHFLIFLKEAKIQTLFLKCDIISTNATCTLKLNITNYANSNQSVYIDYGDGTSETFQINPYCMKLL